MLENKRILFLLNFFFVFLNTDAFAESNSLVDDISVEFLSQGLQNFILEKLTLRRQLGEFTIDTRQEDVNHSLVSTSLRTETKLACNSLHLASQIHFIDPRLDPNLIQLASSLSSYYDRECLKVSVGIIWTNETYVVIEDDEVGRTLLRSLKDTTFGVSNKNCIMLLSPQPPSPELLRALLPSGRVKKFFLAFCESKEVLHNFLLNDNMRENENAVGMMRNEDGQWEAYIRQLYTSLRGPKIYRVLRWCPRAAIDYDIEVYPEQMKNFYGEKFRATTLDFLPFTNFDRQAGTRIVKELPSLDVFILREIARNLNFTYDIVAPEDGLWGTCFDNGTWSGVVGDLQFRRANFSLVLSLTVERRFVVDYTRMYFTDPMTFVTTKSRPLPQWQKVFEPFAGTVWVLWGITLGGCSLLYHCMRRRNPRNWRVTFAQSCLDIYGSFFSQTLSEIPSRITTQVFIAIWLLYSLLTTTYYKSALMAVLAVPSVSPTLNSLQELYDSNLEYGMIDAKGSEYQLFSTSQLELYQKLFQKMSFYSSAESMRRVAKGHYAYIYFRANLESIVSTEYTDQGGKTDMHIAAENFFPGGYAWGFPKGAPYMRTFDQMIQRCLQGGLVTRWVTELNEHYGKEKRQKQDSNSGGGGSNTTPIYADGLVVLKMTHLQGVFIALVLGCSCGGICFVVEALLGRSGQAPSDGRTPFLSRNNVTQFGSRNLEAPARNTAFLK
ncbi:Ionotropic glutamate receptor L-glutamate and glycine-binding domain [Trinorchestia longiramus]|nr:Ionotropic glutamate receptor L-glutamate and glycine-binding domain [Trinorchestia longiramus]